MILPALSIRQPWAALIVLLGQFPFLKDVENRRWPCPTKYIGQRVLIHAGLSSTRIVGENESIIEAAQRITFAVCGVKSEEFEADSYKESFSFGGIVGIATIPACVRGSASPWAEPGAWHWLMAKSKPLPFYPCLGRLGFFEVDYPHQMSVEAL